MANAHTALAMALLYAGCVGFFQAGERRSAVAFLARAAPARAGLRVLSWMAVLAALWLAAQPQGWERGAPIWLGLFAFAGGLSLLVSALAPRAHALSGLGAVIVGLAAAALVVVGDMAAEAGA